MITIKKRLFILVLLFFTIIGFASANEVNTPNYNNDSANEDITHNMVNLENNSLNYKKYNKLVSSNDNSNEVSSNNNNKNITNSNEFPPHIIVEEINKYTDNSIIQNIISESSPGSTIEFTGSLYKELSLNIDKPLNIISKTGTVITTTSNLPVFNIINGGSGTTITGFTINTEGTFVNAKDVSNINIEKNKISKSKTGISFYNVFNSKIQNNEFLDFKTAIDIRKSRLIIISKNKINTNKLETIGINLENNIDSEGIKIIDNQLLGPGTNPSSTGINVDKEVYNVLIKGNIIKNWYEGIYFKKSINNFNINNNTITNNIDGVILESGKLNGFSFTKNVVTDNEGYGILLDNKVEGYTSNPIVENNYFTKNGMDMRSVGDTGFEIGRNFAKNLCHKFHMKLGFNVKFLKNGNNIIASVIGSKNSRVTDLPNFQGTLNIDGKDYTLQFKNGIAYLDLSGTGSDGGLGNSQFGIGKDIRGLGDWGYSVDSMSDSELENYLKEYLGYSNKKSDNNQDNQSQDQSNSTSNQGSGSKSSGSSSGESYVSSSTNGASSSASSSPSGGSGSSSSSSSSSTSTSATDSTTSNSPESPGSEGSSSSNPSLSNKVVAKEISVDDEKYKVTGVVGLISLIILVIGIYYREDVFEMIGNN